MGDVRLVLPEGQGVEQFRLALHLVSQIVDDLRRNEGRGRRREEEGGGGRKGTCVSSTTDIKTYTTTHNTAHPTHTTTQMVVNHLQGVRRVFFQQPGIKPLYE
jgi:hypothetical protein